MLGNVNEESIHLWIVELVTADIEEIVDDGVGRIREYD